MFISSCNQNNNVTELTGQEWLLQSFEPKGEGKIQVNKDEVYMIEFIEDLSLKGQADCNSYGGKYTIHENRQITIGNIGRTKVGCGNSQDKIFYEALKSVTSYYIKNNSLLLFYEGGKSKLIFKN